MIPRVLSNGVHSCAEAGSVKKLANWYGSQIGQEHQNCPQKHAAWGGASSNERAALSHFKNRLPRLFAASGTTYNGRCAQ